ncbi:GTPase ObgE [Candidatus Peregrinibacteria bacterium]|nr:GTPase ObgE [Candidatus Peregrinibacteria bacterium]
MFCDSAKVKFIAGNGGNGCVSFRREKYVPYGGPDGGDGGRGGSIIIRANENITTLSDFRTRKMYKAADGRNGQGQNKAGVSGEDLILEVPVGTLILKPKTLDVYEDLDENYKDYVVVKGGQGGRGNAHFATSVFQAPKFAEIGEPGEETEVILELKLIADIGIIGLPSAGKSTLLSRISNAKPKIAPYPFTTLIPNLGITDIGKVTKSNIHDSFVVADIPGLIEGAHKGKGLGHEFLKHIVRTKALIHIIDINENELYKTYKTILTELKKYDPDITKKPQIVALNKIDTLDPELAELFKKDLKKHLKSIKTFLISAVTGAGIPELIMQTFKILNQIKEKEPSIKTKKSAPLKIFKPHLKLSGKRYEISMLKSKKEKIFVVKGRGVEKIAQMTNFSNDEAVERIYTYLEKSGIQKALVKKGACEGDQICISNKILIFRK